MVIIERLLEDAQISLPTRDHGSHALGVSLGISMISQSSGTPLFISSLSIPRDAASLGGLVLDLNAPWQDFCPTILDISDADVMVWTQHNVRETLKGLEKQGAAAWSKNAVSSLLKHGRRSLYDITAVELTRYSLLNSGEYFGRISRVSEAREWLETTIKYGFELYLIVGLSTVKDLSVERSIGLATPIQVLDSAFTTIATPVNSSGTATQIAGVGGEIETKFTRGTMSRFIAR